MLAKKINYSKIMLITVVAAMVLGIGMGQDLYSQLRNKAYSTAGTYDVSSISWQSEILDDFEESRGWKVIPTPYDPAFINSRVDQSYQNGAPRALRDTPAKKVFGVKFQFRYPGYNFLTIFPPVLQEKDGTEALDPVSKERIGPGIAMPGVIRKISVWVMSQGKDYVLEGYVRDWEGNSHKLVFGSLKYIGWRPLSVDIPTNIPQEIASYPKNKTLLFTKFIIRATPHTSTEETYVFFDQLKVLTNKFDVHFDGAEISTDWGGKLRPVKGTANLDSAPADE